jgi:dihydroneopterin aldolase
MTDRIVITGIEAFAHHGVLEHERQIGQRFLADVTLEVDLAAAGRSDDLADTSDYGAVASTVHDVLTSGPFQLIEALAERIAQSVLDDERVVAVDVVVHKPGAPIAVPFQNVRVEIRRTRART